MSVKIPGEGDVKLAAGEYFIFKERIICRRQFDTSAGLLFKVANSYRNSEICNLDGYC